MTQRHVHGVYIFSQHRGVIQFVQSEVNKRLDEPTDSLITPDAIFDHFIDRIREIPEYSSLVRVVYESGIIFHQYSVIRCRGRSQRQ